MPPGQLTPVEFVAKWSPVELSERSASQEHFLDLCRMLGQPTPAEHDATGAEYTFEKGVAVSGTASAGSQGDYGFADVWWRGKFAWEYKRRGKYRDLAEAYRQLCQYREALENPPLLIVSDIARTEIHSNFTGTAKQVHILKLEHFAEPYALDVLRRVFTDPASFRPTLTPERVTEEVAAEFAAFAERLRKRKHEPRVAAHFLMKCMFCLFAEDVGLLPNKLFERLLKTRKNDLAALTIGLTELFEKMRTGGAFGVDEVPWFNGGLFDESPALALTPGDVQTLIDVAGKQWDSVEPTVFGTLFERSFDPEKESLIGAHYTGRDDIMLIVEPVVMAPLRREWEQVKSDVESQLERRRAAKTPKTKSAADKAIADALQGFVARLASVRILDPACGSANFLYVALQQLLNLEKEVITFAARPDIALGLFPRVRPTQLHGIEINPYAAELAQVVIWIGYLQWMRDNGFVAPRDPILEPLQTIENRDAILDFIPPLPSGEGRVRAGSPGEGKGEGHIPSPSKGEGQGEGRITVPAQWPVADFIIGNPPFLGRRQLREGLGADYVEKLQQVYRGELPEGSDLCCYWFELARRIMNRKGSIRVGLLATQGIRGGSNRKVLERICADGRIFFAESDRVWVLEGATVHISMIGFAKTNVGDCLLDRREVPSINPDLSADVDVTVARKLAENKNVGFRGTVSSGTFDIDLQQARRLLAAPNPTNTSNVRVMRPWLTGLDATGRVRGRWIIDFGIGIPEDEASRFEAPFEFVSQHVRPERDKVKNGEKQYAHSSLYPYWQLWNPRPELREACAKLTRVIATPNLTKHRLFLFLDTVYLPSQQLFVFGRSDDCFMGVLHSSLHELWSRRQGTQLREAESGCRYTIGSCFETFPLPWSPGREPTDHPAYQRISDAARELNEQRERWLNPPEWIEPIAKIIDGTDDFSDVPAEARPLIRQSAIMAAAVADPRLKKRTLTNLYNERPTWLRLAHDRLDRAVLAAYAATDPPGGWDEAWAEVWTETGAGQPLEGAHTLAARRAETDQRVLANLLRLNLARAAGSSSDSDNEDRPVNPQAQSAKHRQRGAS